jgi:hypothetical protein
MLIQQDTQRRWEGRFAKAPLQITPPTSHEFCKSPLPPPMSSPLDQDRVTEIGVSIVCTEILVSTSVTPDFTRKTECISYVRQDQFTHT